MPEARILSYEILQEVIQLIPLVRVPSTQSLQTSSLEIEKKRTSSVSFAL